MEDETIYLKLKSCCIKVNFFEEMSCRILSSCQNVKYESSMVGHLAAANRLPPMGKHHNNAGIICNSKRNHYIYLKLISGVAHRNTSLVDLSNCKM